MLRFLLKRIEKIQYQKENLSCVGATRNINSSGDIYGKFK